MTATALTQNDVYTPAEAFAFHEGFEDVTIARFRGATPEVTDTMAGLIVTGSALNPAEANAYYEGVQAGKAKFEGLAYSSAPVS